MRPTLIGEIASVAGGVVRVRLKDDLSSTLIMVEGETYRVGQIGGFVRIPLGYVNLYAVCTQVGADAMPNSELQVADQFRDGRGHSAIGRGYRWLTVVLFGEGLGNDFERGVGQYPTVGDEVHIVTNDDLAVIFGWSQEVRGTISVGEVASTAAISAEISVPGLVNRHCAIVGSTGAGKSNLVTVLLESVSSDVFPTSRAIVIDPHGEYGAALEGKARVFKVKPDRTRSECQLRVPYWALPFAELQKLAIGSLQPIHEAAVRDEVLALKRSAAELLNLQSPLETLTADSPVPFSIKQLWYQLDRFERITFQKSGTAQGRESECNAISSGDADQLKPAEFPPADPYNKPPYRNQRKRNIEKQLELLASRIRDNRYAFLLAPGGGFDPALDGTVEADLDGLVREWVGHEHRISVFDVSGIPSEIRPEIVGTMLRVIYDLLFWGQELPIGGQHQPLLVVVDEAHLFVPEGESSAANRMLSVIAKEGRKYGVGLMLVSQRPSELDRSVLSQCGSIVSMRLTNQADRSSVAASVPDDLGGLIELLPSLRTGEGIFLGEIMPIPTRVRIRRALNKPVGDDPKLPDAWQQEKPPDSKHYTNALENWRRQSLGDGIATNQEEDSDLDD